MTSADSLLAQGIAAAKASDRGAARQLLTRALRRNPDSEAAWLWLGAVLDTPQGRAFCLRQALALNSTNQTVQRGLRALEKVPRATVLVAQPAPVPRPRSTPEPWLDQKLTPTPGPRAGAVGTPQAEPLHRPLLGQRRFWRLVVACLSIVAVGLLGMLAFTTLSGSGDAGDGSLAVAPPSPSPATRGTLRPTFTSTPTVTPMSTDTPTSIATPTTTPTLAPTATATSSPTPTLTPTATRRRNTKPPPTTAPTTVPTVETPPPAPPPRSLDPRLASLGVRVEPAPVSPGQPHWYLAEARWANEREAAGKHNIFVEVLNARGERALGQMVIVQWADGGVALPVEDRPPPDWAVDFGMYNTLGSYAVSVGGGPSDRIVGLGLGTAEDPHMKVHTCFYLIFRWVY